MIKLINFKTLIVVLSSLTIVVVPATAWAAKPVLGNNNSAVTTGNDVSWPQCNQSLPKNQLFGIVGVNDGLANTTNPCFKTELAWANTSVGNTSQGKSALYVNTANPGNLGVSDWPSSGSSTKYGLCSGSDNQACAYVYGSTEAQLDAQTRISGNSPTNFKWWLDVETDNSWEANKSNNVADLEGMVDYLEGIGVHVGLYSTTSQWNQIAGTVSTSSSLYGLDSWLPGASTLTGAKSNCNLAGLTGGKTTLSQYVSRRVDYDYSCV